jgi:hypothetical protein
MLLPKHEARGQVSKQHFDDANSISIFVKLLRQATQPLAVEQQLKRGASQSRWLVVTAL